MPTTAASPDQTPRPASQDDIEQAIARGTQRYFDDCRARVPAFIDRHFHYPGAVATNRVALGWDMLRAPANLLWAPFFGLACVLKFLVRKSPRFAWLYRLLDRAPAGFTTRVQQHISGLILRELLNRGQSTSLLEQYLVASLQEVYESHSDGPVNDQQFHKLIEPLVDETLIQYRVTRTASADITNSLSCTVLGAFAFQKFTPGGIGLAVMLASMLAKAIATREFILGEGLGGLYYSVFPPEPSLATTAGVMVAVMALLAAFAALSGIVADPVQAAMGLHRRRLHKMLNHLERDFLNKTQSSFRPKDQFVARILDTFDMIKSGLV